nr:unknown [Zea mays]
MPISEHRKFDSDWKPTPL